MKEIENVLICGMGAVGSIYADKIQNYSPNNLKILINKNRLDRYIKNPTVFNGKELSCSYVLPDCDEFKADLIIIATKYDGLTESIQNIKNFVYENTVILSLLNGVTSEQLIAQEYGWDKVLLSYFIGHSAMREGRFITHDGIGKIVFGDKNTDKTNEIRIKEFFDKVNIDYEIPKDIEHALWLKFMLNVSTNQPSAILRMTFGQMNANKKFLNLSKKLMQEVQIIAKAEGIKNTDNMIDEAMISLSKMLPEGKTSMYQDILAHRKTEVEIFAGTVIKLAQKHNIDVPYNKFMYDMFEIIHENIDLESTQTLNSEDSLLKA